MVKLDPEEQDILDSYERGEWRLVEDTETERELLRQYARATLKKLEKKSSEDNNPC